MPKQTKQQRVDTKKNKFSAKTKLALAHRAGFRCSLRGCGKVTSCSNQESASSHINIGDAAHIYAASPGGRRYNPSMTDAQRSHISNGIWLCVTHHRIIDSDQVRYTTEELYTMKNEHEHKIANELMSIKLESNADLIAIGFDIIFVGKIIGMEANKWQIRIEKFIFGTTNTLIDFIDNFNSLDVYDRFVLANELGDGRQVVAPLEWKECTLNPGSYIVSLCVQKKAKRVNVHDFGKTFDSGENNDFVLKGGDLSMVSGLQAFEVILKQALSTMQGEMLFCPNAGTKIIDYFNLSLYRDSGWLSHLVKLELIRMACLPNTDGFTTLRSVLKVKAINLLPSDQKKDWLQFDIELDLEGEKNWKRNVRIFIPTDYEEYLRCNEMIKKRASSFIQDTR